MRVVRMTSVVKPGNAYVWSFTDDSWNAPSWWHFYPDIGESRIGDDDPNWREKVARREDASNNYSASRNKVWFLPGLLRYQQIVPKEVLEIYPWAGYLNGWNVRAGGLIQASWFPDSSNIDTTFSSAVRSRAIAEFNEKALRHMHPVRGAFWSELDQSLRMLHGTAKRLFRSVESLTKKAKAIHRRGLKARALTKQLSQLWLEGSFGWRPLFADIESICLHMATKKFRQKEVLITGFGKFEETIHLPWTVKHKDSGALGYHRNESIHSVLIRGVLDLNLTDSASEESWKHDTLSNWGLALSEVVPALWERTAYSFLADYFINLQDILEAAFVERRFFRFLNLVEKKARIDTYALDKYINMHDAGNNLTMEINEHLDPMFLRLERKHFTREKDPILMPQVELTYPPLGSLRWLNMASLLGARTNPKTSFPVRY